jgi:hypothetical protein
MLDPGVDRCGVLADLGGGGHGIFSRSGKTLMSPRLAARIAESDRLQHGQEAEGQGLRAANVFEKPFRFSSDPYRQARFELGFKDGRALLAIGEAGAASEGSAQGGIHGSVDPA